MATSVIAGDRLDLIEEQRRPMVELAGVGVVQRVLKLRLVQPRADRDVLRGLHIKRDALDFGEIGPQPRDHLVDRAALILGLSCDEHAAVVERETPPPAPTAASDRCHGRVPHYGIEQGLLALGHGLEGDILRRLGQADDQSGVLLGKEALGNDDVEIPGQRDRAEHHHERDEAVPQHDLETGLIEVEQAIEAAFRQPVQPSVLMCSPA